MRKLSQQFPPSRSRVVYAKAGTLFAACVVEDINIVIDHMACWAPSRTVAEGHYLIAILNSETARARIALHRDLAAAATYAEKLAAAVPLTEGAYFTTSRRAIRAALAADGIGARIDRLVTRLLDE